MNGLIPFYKPIGLSSYDLIRRIKKIIPNEKIGHGGTLDPLAEGVLIVGVGREWTKKLQGILKNSTKEYRAVVELGAVSETDDAEGPITKISNIQYPISNEIKKALKSFEGEIWQVPPFFSAKKIKGQPAYKKARLGQKVKLQPQKVNIEKIELLRYEPPELELNLIVHSGVYIRAIARDLGEKLGTGAYLKNLIRPRVADFTLDEAIQPEDLTKDFIELFMKVGGFVQGVNFRYFAKTLAQQYGLFGSATNMPDGSVEIIAQGKEQPLQKFLADIKNGPPMSKIENIDFRFRRPQKEFRQFAIL